MSLLKAIKAQLGLSSTATQNFTLTAEAADGTMKLARGNSGATTQDILTVDASGVVTAAQGLVTNRLVLGTAQNSTSGTSIDFTSIPSWAKRITVMFNGVSTNGTSNVQIQIGSGSVTTTGYNAFGSNFSTTSASVNGVAYTSGFGIKSASASESLGGLLTLALLSGNVWTAQGSFSTAANSNIYISSGNSAALSGTLDRVRITTVNGTDTFDAGSINILYEG